MTDKKQPTQAEKFEQAVRELDCEDSEEAFDAKLRTIAKQRPKDDLPPPAKGRTAKGSRRRAK